MLWKPNKAHQPCSSRVPCGVIWRYYQPRWCHCAVRGPEEVPAEHDCRQRTCSSIGSMLADGRSLFSAGLSRNEHAMLQNTSPHVLTSRVLTVGAHNHQAGTGKGRERRTERVAKTSLALGSPSSPDSLHQA